MEIIDSHAHLTWDSFAEDQKAVIDRAFAGQVRQIVQAGVDLTSLSEMKALAENYTNIYYAVGLHPHEAKHWTDDVRELFKQNLNHPKLVAIGECGLDYHYNHSEPGDQRAAFVEQIRLAKEFKKPLILHTREAWEETFELLEKEGQGDIQGVFHCFTGGPQHLDKVRALGFYVSFSGIVTFNSAKEIQEAAKLMDEGKILVETDCPYLAPIPYRGKRNEPLYVWKVAEKIAQLRGVSLDHIAAVTCANTRKLFGLPEPG